ncbi:MAG: isoprenylcysteine carboxylmethyltransferase family protein [Eubacteriales bacterium]|nr:isoprenylcysteine carboxylmethyltransferase family protein [Eubacteriales bacterium]
MSNKKHLPMYGVGPVYVCGIIFLTVVGIWLSASRRIPSGQIEIFRIPFAVIGICFIVMGAVLWFSAVFRSRVDEHIKNNALVTTGIYAWVRNPIYSAFLIACTGVLLLANNLWLLVLPPLFWLFLTVLMKCTEEKWLENLYGQEYLKYCQKVNRCIPWPPMK